MNQNLSKWAMPSFLTSIISIIAITLNHKLGWELSPDKLIASVALTINFGIVAMSADIAKMKAGERPNFNSTKLFTLLFACFAIGFAQYFGVDLNMEDVLFIAGSAAAFITGKGIRDVVQAKRQESEQNELAPYKIDDSTHV